MKVEKILHRVNSTCKGSEAREHVVCSRNQKFEAKAKGEEARGAHDQLHVTSWHDSGRANVN